MNVLMPETATVVRWLKAEGDTVQRGDVLVEIETDKTVLEIEAEVDGTLQSILVPGGTPAVPANAQLARLLTAGEAQEAPPAAAAGPAATPNGRLLSSPLARRLAREAGITLASIAGSGPGGRIVERDVKRAVDERGAGAPAPAPAAAVAAAPSAPASFTGASADAVKKLFAPGSYEEVALDGMRATIAQRLQEAKQTVPHFYVTMDVELDALLALRRQLNEAAPQDAAGAASYKLSINDFVVRALAVALQRVPEANAVWAGDRILRFSDSDVGVAVSVEGGLYTPVVRSAQGKTLSGISNELKALADRARQRRLRAEEYQGGTTAVSNLGMHGVKEFAAIINPPHATMLAVGQAEARVVVKDGAPAVVQALTVTLSCDHRVVDGATGARLLAQFKDLMQRPLALLV